MKLDNDDDKAAAIEKAARWACTLSGQNPDETMAASAGSPVQTPMGPMYPMASTGVPLWNGWLAVATALVESLVTA